jgi:hypothetical protein
MSAASTMNSATVCRMYVWGGLSLTPAGYTASRMYEPHPPPDHGGVQAPGWDSRAQVTPRTAHLEPGGGLAMSSA